MKFIFSLILACFAAFGQNVPVISGHNPSVELGTTLYNVGTARIFTGTGAPTNPTGPISDVGAVRGDRYLDTGSLSWYSCTSATCTNSTDWKKDAFSPIVDVRSYGVNGSGTDPVNFQNAINDTAGLGYCLYIPSGFSVAMQHTYVSIPSNTCLIGANAATSLIQSQILSTPGVGILDINGTSNIRIQNIGIDGGYSGAPVGVNYSSLSGNPNNAVLTTGSSVWVHLPASGVMQNFTFLDNQIQHTSGYAMYFDGVTASGALSTVKILRNKILNSRNTLFGTSGGDLNYGGWTGGILFNSNGGSPLSVLYAMNSIEVSDNTFSYITGNALWFHQSTSGGPSFGNVSISANKFNDCGLDAIQLAGNYATSVRGNTGVRIGFVSLTDNTAGAPKWLQNKTPVFIDMAGEVANFAITGNVVDAMNGEGYDLDGAFNGTVTGNQMNSCFYPAGPPAANYAQCGPSTNVGSNLTQGLSTNNSAGVGAVGNGLVITDNNFYGVGYSGIALFGTQNAVVRGNFIQQFPVVGLSTSPILLGNLVGHPSTYNTVSGNTISANFATGTAAIAEDPTYQAFTNGQVNYVYSNFLLLSQALGGSLYEFAKDPNSSSGTGPLVLASVTTAAPVVTQSTIQTEGTSTSTISEKHYLTVGGVSQGQVFQMAIKYYLGPSHTLATAPSAGSVSAGGAFYCTDCTLPSNPGTCTGSGTGALAISDGTNWVCR